jgi:hypothetical protein
VRPGRDRSSRRISPDVGEGALLFDDVAPGKIVIREQKVDGYGQPVALCGGDRLDLTHRAISYILANGEALSCDWFNVPA